MQQPTTHASILGLACVTGTVLALAALFRKVLLPTRMKTQEALLADPATEYDEALAKFAGVQALEATLALNLLCRTTLLTHGNKRAHAIILMHGMTNCPRQYSELARLLYERGYNVLIPRMPRNGLADLDTDALASLTAWVITSPTSASRWAERWPPGSRSRAPTSTRRC